MDGWLERLWWKSVYVFILLNQYYRHTAVQNELKDDIRTRKERKRVITESTSRAFSPLRFSTRNG